MDDSVVKNKLSNSKLSEEDKISEYISLLLNDSSFEIKADEHFRMLQKSIVDVEERLQASRRIYNANVSRYNQVVLSFPSSIIAKINNYSELEFFEANDVAKENVNIKLDDN